MPITISGSGTITGIGTGGLPDGCIATDDLANNAVTAGKMGTTEQSRLCAAWVNFNGTGTVAIRTSYNVSSITDNAVGDYSINFTTPLADANYAIAGVAKDEGGGCFLEIISTTSTAARVATLKVSTVSLNDSSIVTAAIFR